MSDLDDKDFAIRAPYIQKILELEQRVKVLTVGLQNIQVWDLPETLRQVIEVELSAFISGEDVSAEQQEHVLTLTRRALIDARHVLEDLIPLCAALNQTPQQSADQVLRWHVEWMRTLEPAAHMYPSDLEKFKEQETFAQAYSVAVGCPDETSEPLVRIPSPPLPKESKE